MQRFLATHDVKDFEGLILIRTKEDRRFRKESQFVLKLCKGIQRTGFDVAHRILQQFSSDFLKTGRLSKKEHEELKRLHKLYGNNWKKIGLLMNRSRVNFTSIQHCASKSWKKGSWTSCEDKALLTSVKKFLDTKKSISWREVSKDVKTR